jgi:chromosome segregation ATPase
MLGFMEPDNLTIRILQEIRDEVRNASDRSEKSFAKMDERFAKADQRFEVIETTLKDLAEQMVFLARGIKTALDNRGAVESRLSDAERRLDELEKRVGH